MTRQRLLSRRDFTSGAVAAGAAALCALPLRAAPARAAAQSLNVSQSLDASSMGLAPDAPRNQTRALQKALDRAALTGVPLHLPSGRYRVAGLMFKSGLALQGVPGKTVLEFLGGTGFVTGAGLTGLRIAGLVFDGAGQPFAGSGNAAALMSLTDVTDLVVSDCRFTRSSAGGLALNRAAGRVADCNLSAVAGAALFSEDAVGLDIVGNRIEDCANNGILVWRSREGDDGTRVLHNRVSNVRAEAGGSGQNGNGINLFRAANVLVQGNRLSDCAFSAVRANSASNCRILANSCRRIGEVALYAEFAFEGAVIAENVVDGAAMGVSVTNFQPQGGRLAVIQGNILRNLATRPDGSRGIGVGAEADTVINANVVENAARLGIQLGWGPALRDVVASANIVRGSPIGIGASVHPQAGGALIADNLISGARDGAVRAMDHARPIGPDLAREGAARYPNLTLRGNLAR